LPKSGREAIYTEELDAMSGKIQAGRAEEQAITNHDEVLTTLQQFDKRAAEEMATIDQAVKAEEVYNQFRGMDLARIEAEHKAMKAKVKKIKGIKTSRNDVEKSFGELDEMIKALPDSPELQAAVALQHSYHQGLLGLKQAEFHEGTTKALLDAARKGSKKGGVSKDPAKNFNNVFERVTHDGWEQVATKLLSPEDAIAIQEPVARALDNLMKFHENDNLWKTIDHMTQFFKTYATATPGFHLRNAMSASFMNMSDGVTMANHAEAVRSWKKYLKDPVAYLDDIQVSDPQLYDAYVATFGSGAGGNFVEAELGQASMGGKLLHNKWTNASHKLGGNVEGPVRLAAAINSTKVLKHDSYQALARVNRLHFDYSKISSLDRGMKRLIPFWTFMSRNLPLQMQQMVLRPKLYAAYNSALRNLGNPINSAPEWMNGNVIGLDRQGPGDRWGLTPDLPHVNAIQDVAETFDIRDPGRAVSNLNPVAVAPLEAIVGEKFRFGTEMGTAERVLHPLQQIVAPIAQGNRLTGGRVLATDRYEGREVEKIANWLGIPVHKVTVEQMQNARKYANQ